MFNACDAYCVEYSKARRPQSKPESCAGNMQAFVVHFAVQCVHACAHKINNIQCYNTMQYWVDQNEWNQRNENYIFVTSMTLNFKIRGIANLFR